MKTGISTENMPGTDGGPNEGKSPDPKQNQTTQGVPTKSQGEQQNQQSQQQQPNQQVQQLPVEESPERVRAFEKDQLGPCERTVALTRNVLPRQRLAVTFAPNQTYSIEFENGRAKIPQKIADYISAQNPGNCMRLV